MNASGANAPANISPTSFNVRQNRFDESQAISREAGTECELGLSISFEVASGATQLALAQATAKNISSHITLAQHAVTTGIEFGGGASCFDSMIVLAVVLTKP